MYDMENDPDARYLELHEYLPEFYRNIHDNVLGSQVEGTFYDYLNSEIEKSEEKKQEFTHAYTLFLHYCDNHPVAENIKKEIDIRKEKEQREKKLNELFKKEQMF